MPSTGHIVNHRVLTLMWAMKRKSMNFSVICAIEGYKCYKSIRKLGGFDSGRVRKSFM